MADNWLVPPGNASLVEPSRRRQSTVREPHRGPCARREPFRWNYSVQQCRSSRRPRGRKNLHRTLVSHVVFLARNLRPHYSAFISGLGGDRLSRFRAPRSFFFFGYFFSFSCPSHPPSVLPLVSVSFNLFCASARSTRGNLSRRLDGFSAIFRPAAADDHRRGYECQDFRL